MNAPASAEQPEPLTTSTFAVEGMRCAGCIAKIEHGLAAQPDIASARVNFTTRQVKVAHLADIDAEAVAERIRALGFEAHEAQGERPAGISDESRKLVLALAVAGFAAMNVMLLSVSVWSGADGATRGMFHWLSALIALPAAAYSGQTFFKSAWSALRRGRTNMDVPISIGVVLALGLSVYETATGGIHAYFDGALMLLFFLLGGRFLDSVMRQKAQDGITALLRRLPNDALVLAGDGSTSRRAIDELAPKMTLLVAAGERIAADGIVLSGESDIDRSLVTGESDAEPVREGSEVLAGTINLSAPLTVKITSVGNETTIAEIARLMESAGQGKSRYTRIADRAARLYAPAVHSLALLTFAGWLIAGMGLHASITTAIAVLIITCPCALGLAVPISQVVVTGAMMRKGIMVKDGSGLERLARADMALFDKTGTITIGRPLVTSGLPEDMAERSALLALARASNHPASRAIVCTLGDSIEAAEARDLQEVPGKGVRGVIDGRQAMLGHPDWVGAAARDGSHTAFRLGDGAIHAIAIEDRARTDAPAAIARMQQMGIGCTMVSGDAPDPVARLAAQLGIEGKARLRPEDKVAAIREREEAGHHVLMIGDGLNDGPALRAASVSMAPSSATDVGRQAADIVFLGDGLMPVPIAIAAARRTMAVVKQNFALAVIYNAFAVPLAIAGFVTPLIAAAAMSGSSLVVVANALRLRGAAR
ncbi:heavy metal translocating P-type ATPase [Sphingosinithalassobacter portus]|uniref:heavy metal translocating P-type ATPase n=1 Tax=Stakelama portus TaxID=2676234 RepID=UPI000D6E803D|nr:heavy metal translocating P-type ATPase [Sphingosinithalassobacter portus]